MKQWITMVATVFAAVFLLALFIHWPWDTSMPTEPTTMKDPIPPQSNQGTTAPKDEPDIYIRYIPEEVENPENLPVLKWVCLTQFRYGLTGNRPIKEAAMHEVNQMLADRDMPFRLQIITISTITPSLIPKDWFSLPQAQELLNEADLIYGYMLGDEMREYYAPITEHVLADTKPTLNSSIFCELDWIRTTVDGEIYGIPLVLDYPVGNGWKVNPDLFQKYGLTQADFQKNYWEMDQVFAKIYEQNGNQPFLWVDSDACGSYTMPYLEYPEFVPMGISSVIDRLYQYAGYCFAIDRTSGSPKIVNLYDTDSVRAAWAANKRYKSAGYTTKLTRDELESGDHSRIKVSYARIGAGWVHTTRWGEKQEYLCIPAVDRDLVNTFNEAYMNGVAAVSQHKTEALQLLNLITEDEAFRMQLLFGKEGRDYEIKDGYYEITVQDDGSYYSMNVLSPLSFFSGLTAKESDDRSSAFACGTDPDFYIAQDGKTKQESRLDSMNNIDSSYYPVAFDYSGFSKELSAIRSVCQTYFSKLTELTEAEYDQMLQAFRDAGSEKIIAELQRQLDEWLANSPDWQ